MLTDARDIPAGTRLEADLCIIGAGAAGISLAREFIGGSVRVVLVESGRLEPEPAADALSDGHVEGRAYFPLASTRDRVFGGTTASWAGECRPLDAADFGRRDWIPASGWPFGPQELSGYYERARSVLGLGAAPFEAGDWSDFGVRVPDLGSAGVRTAAFHYSRVHLGVTYRADLEACANIHVLLGLTAIELEAADPPVGVSAVRVAPTDGGGSGSEAGMRIVARAYVLAAGGIENPRLLLLSDRVARRGLGNGHDLVGRYFMEHLYVNEAARLAGDRSLGRFYTRGHTIEGHRIRGILALDPDVRAREGITNFCGVLETGSRRAAVLAARSVAISLARGRQPVAPAARLRDALAVLAAAAAARLRGEFGDDAGGKRGNAPWGDRLPALKNVCEQAPNPDSRVVLARDRDPLGCRRVELRWRLSPIDRRSARRGHEILARALDGIGVGFTSFLGRESDPWPERLRGARHHMGTTRMHIDRNRGVIDADCRVHGVENLFVAGSSVFPTGGAANPTLTIVALALRLADHLADRLR